MTNNPADTEATVRRGIIAAVLLAALFLLPAIALQSDDFNPLVLLALPLMPGALALAAATVALGLANETIGEAGAALAASQTRHP
ncbi:hypothetical protein KHQ06_32635 [Nocardia tengchongensis]|uniref:Uncharacterized protein n=1 Tax=Nocardia tengchongensis TaxID=2055889 RepID=A0ABX8CMG9_9NOCA|nr:hypothetical protein [Nocardia tengchongensis]QVI20789.1 hypothetical protein KHQ06_32635 [Nocardia tengchongensis]